MCHTHSYPPQRSARNHIYSTHFTKLLSSVLLSFILLSRQRTESIPATQQIICGSSFFVSFILTLVQYVVVESIGSQEHIAVVRAELLPLACDGDPVSFVIAQPFPIFEVIFGANDVCVGVENS